MIDTDGHAFTIDLNSGMTLRDYMAGQALIGIIAHPQGKAGDYKEAAIDAYRHADAMIKIGQGN